MITAVVNTKGGAGKSLVSLNLAVAMAEANLKTLLIDADGQHALTRAFAHRTNSAESGLYNVQPIDLQLILNIRDLQYALSEARQMYDEVVIDTAGYDLAYVWQIVCVSDLVLVPVNAGMTDIEVTSEIATKLMRCQHENNLYETLKCRCLVNGFKKNTVISSIVGANLSMLDEMLPKIDAPFSHRPTYPNAFARGLSAIELAPKSDAAKEVRQLLSAIKQSLIQ